MDEAEEERERGCGAEDADESMEDDGSCLCPLATRRGDTAEDDPVGGEWETEGKALKSGLDWETEELCVPSDAFSWSCREAMLKKRVAVL